MPRCGDQKRAETESEAPGTTQNPERMLRETDKVVD